MAIYHLEAKIIGRGIGRFAVAAAAYMSCSQIFNEYDGIQHDYTRKRGLIWQQVFLPDMAPPEWKEREKLWNAVEESEKSKDSRLAREFVVALPIELVQDEWSVLLTDFIKKNFVADGMSADVAIHDTDGHNPHAHIMLTVRPLTETGQWAHKTEKEYLCIRNGEERGLTAAEFKTAQAEGWEKQYPYRLGKKKVYMTPSQAEMKGYERVSKYPKSTKYGRQNPISERWNSDDQLLRWREAWADAVNQQLEKNGRSERIDHRSHAARGLEEQPTIHEGVAARSLEQRGIISDRCEWNRQIKADNALLRDLKQQVKKLVQAVKDSLPAIVEDLETLRSKMFVLCYQLSCIRRRKGTAGLDIEITKSAQRNYQGLIGQIKEKETEHQTLQSEKKKLPKIHIRKHKALSLRIAELTEELEELRSEKVRLLQRMNYVEGADVTMFEKIFPPWNPGCSSLNGRSRSSPLR